MNSANSTQLRVYELIPVLDNPLYEGFGGLQDLSLLGNPSRHHDLRPQLFTAADGKTDWCAPKLARLWKPVHVIGCVRPFNDYPFVNLSIPAFSQRAIDVLEPWLSENGELLPIITSVGNYSIFNCTTILDALDHSRSDLDFMINSHLATGLTHLTFRLESIANKTLFFIRENGTHLFATETFARKVREHKLEGFEFRLAWPFPHNLNWRRERDQLAVADELTTQPTPENRPIKGNSVIIRLKLSRKQADASERLRFEQIADELDAILVNPRKNAKYYGSLEANEIVDGEARYFLSAPDADELAKKLKPWLKSLDWPGRKIMVKRYGEYVDNQATEEEVKL